MSRDPILRNEIKHQGWGRNGVMSPDGTYQNMGGRIARLTGRDKEQAPPGIHRDISLTKRWMDAMGIDLDLPLPDADADLGRRAAARGRERARARLWALAVRHVLAHEPRIRSMLYLPFNDPAACVRMVEEFGDRKGIIGFMVTAPHRRGNLRERLHAALCDAAGAQPAARLPRQLHLARADLRDLQPLHLGARAGLLFFNMAHMTNWVMNALPERFPKLKVLWIESGLAWVPFVMQRLDNEYMMRTSEAPALKRKPSDYMRDMFYTTQPMEMVDNHETLEVTLKMINAETQLCYASDYPHWDMDLPSTIYDLPFLSEEAKRNILGGNAQRAFNLKPVFSEEKLEPPRRARRGRAIGIGRAPSPLPSPRWGRGGRGRGDGPSQISSIGAAAAA